MAASTLDCEPRPASVEAAEEGGKVLEVEDEAAEEALFLSGFVCLRLL